MQESYPPVPAEDQIVVYEGPGCGRCVATISSLRRKLPSQYVVARNTADAQFREEALELAKLEDSGSPVVNLPVVKFRDMVWTGIRPDMINKVASILLEENELAAASA